MTTVLRDIQVAVRTLRRGRLVTALAIVAFALGIGVTTACVSIFNSVLLTPFAVSDSERIVRSTDTQPACSYVSASFPKYHDWKAAIPCSGRSAAR